jgi:hypothetical protein
MIRKWARARGARLVYWAKGGSKVRATVCEGGADREQSHFPVDQRKPPNVPEIIFVGAREFDRAIPKPNLKPNLTKTDDEAQNGRRCAGRSLEGI